MTEAHSMSSPSPAYPWLHAVLTLLILAGVGALSALLLRVEPAPRPLAAPLPSAVVFTLTPASALLIVPTTAPMLRTTTPVPNEPAARSPAPSSATPIPATVSPIPIEPAPPAPPIATAAPPVVGEPRANVPIVMYHYVRYVDRATDPLGFSLSVTPEQLAQQLDWLLAQGYTTVRMDRASACMFGADVCPVRSVALTFDDGYADAYSAALPALQARGMVATFYIITDRVGQPEYVSWEQLAALRDAGMEIGSHTLNHPDLRTLGPEQLAAEVGSSGQVLRERLGVPASSFCYPAGRYNAEVLAAVRAAGYLNATTTRADQDFSEPLALPRVRVFGEITLAQFAAALGAS
jgi:peptidoglycan/xylan/chitin deacetylase (PgdA/CDA1 family)